MVIRKEFPHPPPEGERPELCDWLRHHTINPNQVVAVGGFIEIDKPARQIRYLEYDVNDKGERYPDSTGKRASTSVRVVQLEAVPSDFPTVREVSNGIDE